MLTELHPLMATCEPPAAARATRTCAITGTNGYVGSCLRDFFHGQQWTVRELSRTANPAHPDHWIPFTLQAGVDSDALRGSDVLIHCAYDFRPTRWRDIEAVNVAGTAKLFEAARKAGVSRIILISTMSAFDG